MKRNYFCGCGQPIEEEDAWCIECEIYWKNKYKDDTYITWFLTDELKHKYIKGL